MTVFYFAYYVGKEYIDTDAKRLKYINMTVNVVVLVIIIGIVLRHCGTSIWNKIGIYEVYQAKKSVLESNGLPSRFYTRLINRAFLRMASLYYEPVNLAYLMAFGLIACLSEERIRYRNPKMMLSALGLILTFGKGGYLFTAFIILVQGIYTVIKKNLSEKKSYPLAVAISAFGCITVSVLYYRIGAGRTALYHYYGIIGTFRSILNNPLGYGLGMGGNMGVTFGQEIDWLSSGGETAIMSFAYQIGVPGVFALFILLFTLSKETMIINKKTYIKTISLGVILAGMFQENTFTPQCIIPLMMLQGIYSKKNYRKVMVNKIQNKS